MKVIEKAILFLKNIFNKKDKIKRIEKPKEQELKEEKASFIESLKIEENKKRRIETLTCFGDGLGIQTKMKC